MSVSSYSNRALYVSFCGADKISEVTYGFTNRTPDMKLSRAAYKWLLEQMNSEFTVATPYITFLQKQLAFTNM